MLPAPYDLGVRAHNRGCTRVARLCWAITSWRLRHGY